MKHRITKPITSTSTNPAFAPRLMRARAANHAWSCSCCSDMQLSSVQLAFSVVVPSVWGMKLKSTSDGLRRILLKRSKIFRN